MKWGVLGLLWSGDRDGGQGWIRVFPKWEVFLHHLL